MCVVVLTLTHRCNAVRGHRTGSNNSGAEAYLRRKTNKKLKIIHTTTETNRIAMHATLAALGTLPRSMSL